MKRARRPQGWKQAKPESDRNQLIEDMTHALNFYGLFGEERLQEIYTKMRKELQFTPEEVRFVENAAVRKSNWRNSNWLHQVAERAGVDPLPMRDW